MNQGFRRGRRALAIGCFARRALVALGLIAAATAPAAAAPSFHDSPSFLVAPAKQATPALWEVRDGDTTIYLFGTFHTLDERTRWFDRSVRAAFDRSTELVLETIVPDDPAQIRAIGREVVGPRARPGGFFASTTEVVARSKAAGLSVELGADAVLKRAASDQGKPLAGLERFEDQLRQFARISAAPAPIRPPSAQARAAPVTTGELLAAWKSGDTAAFTSMLAGFEAKAPAAYRILIADRNQRYATWIASRLDYPGTVFVAVGSGHLSGKHSVQNWLSSKGIFARRIG
ncbi:MAG: TraB/GumN family protein [Pseudomonadota bacterium]|nr:TraB/GumN family protein [Pseudomonadota bacterium]